MKKWFARRAAAAVLCLTLALCLAACGGKTDPPPAGGDGVTGTLSGGKGGADTGSGSGAGTAAVPEVDSEKAEQALVLLRRSMSSDDQLAGAVAYLGSREQGETAPLADWLRENCFDLAEEMPFLLEIPAERVLGAGYGDLYCIVPRDESTSLAVNHVTWQSQGNGVWPVADEVLYREEYAQPVLVFANYEEWPDEPDVEITLVTNNGLEVSWCPLADEYGCAIVPTGVDYAPMLMDFAVYGYTTGLEKPDGWEPDGAGWWLPPTDVGLADTTWVCGDWMLELCYGDCGPEYAGTAELRRFLAGDVDLTMLFSGVWRMEDDCLWLDVSTDDGTVFRGSFPILLSPSGEQMHFQRARSGEGMPFLPDGVDTVDLTRSYG